MKYRNALALVIAVLVVYDVLLGAIGWALTSVALAAVYYAADWWLDRKLARLDAELARLEAIAASYQPRSET